MHATKCRSIRPEVDTHLSQARSSLAVIVLSCFVAVLGAKEVVADGDVSGGDKLCH